jgi:uncharacterized protein
VTTSHATREGGCAIAVMAKAPRAGQVKTRLVPPLTPEAASKLSASFLRDITENLRLAAYDAVIHGYVAYAPAEYEALFNGMLAPDTHLVLADGVGPAPQGVQGFGRSLLHAVRSLFGRGHDAVCLLNSDSPNLPTALLSRAALALAEAGDRIVLGPADDGGYYLLGMKAPHLSLFANIDWSTAHVTEQTRLRAGALGLPVLELDAWYDVDDAQSLLRLRHDLATRRQVAGLTPYPAPVTARCIDQLLIHDLFHAA